MSTEDTTKKFNEALSHFYKLKKQYDEQSEKHISKLRSNENLNKKEKQDKFKQLNSTKKCVNCNRNVGTIFKQENHILFVKCGDKESPCKLDIQLQKAKYININDKINDYNDKINRNKRETISSKLDFLFGYKNESNTLKEFNKLKLELIEEVKKYKITNEQYLNIILNSSTETQLLENNTTLVTSIQKFKSLIKSYQEDGDIGFLKDATDLYINTIDKTVKDIQKLKYVNNAVEYDDDDKSKHLLQNQYNIAQLEIPIDKIKDKIIAFIK